jgi:hypothetical protein
MAESYNDGIPLGTIESPEIGQVQRRVRVIGGRGLWAYYVRDEMHTNFVIADSIYNRQAPHFAGQLTRRFEGPTPENHWCLVHGFQEPPRERRLYVEDEDEGLPRMEHR